MRLTRVLAFGGSSAHSVRPSEPPPYPPASPSESPTTPADPPDAGLQSPREARSQIDAVETSFG